ncbi:MAG TPA: hypothetical protein VMY98_05730 [Anaerolineae bacterium]|nr:hypothetical protein [Anaerolineae bacterium]
MMSNPLTEAHCFVGAAVLLAGGAVAHLAGVRWRTVEQGLLVLALLSAVCGLAFSAVSRAGWPLVAAGEVILASGTATILWRVLLARCRESGLQAFAFCAVAVGLIIWGLAQQPGSLVSSAANSLQPAWLFAARLAVALACGAFVAAGGVGVSCLVAAGRGDGRAQVDYGEHTARYAVLVGFPLLTLSLLLAVLGGLYSRGVYWSWSVGESWQLLTWLYYAVLWCGYVLLGWRSRRLWVLASLGLVLTILMLRAVAGMP